MEVEAFDKHIAKLQFPKTGIGGREGRRRTKDLNFIVRDKRFIAIIKKSS